VRGERERGEGREGRGERRGGKKEQGRGNREQGTGNRRQGRGDTYLNCVIINFGNLAFPALRKNFNQNLKNSVLDPTSPFLSYVGIRAHGQGLFEHLERLRDLLLGLLRRVSLPSSLLPPSSLTLLTPLPSSLSCLLVFPSLPL
jgi:hypothetical protein